MADWIVELRQLGRSAVYIAKCERRVGRLTKECEWRVLGDIDPADFIRLRETALSDIAHAKKDRGKVEQVLLSRRSRNHYLAALQSFVLWCVKRKRMAANPMTDVDKVDEVGDVQGARRALTEDEAADLLAVVPDEYKLLYQTLLATGLRRAEPAALLWGDVRLTATAPFLQIAGRDDSPLTLATGRNRRQKTPSGEEGVKVEAGGIEPPSRDNVSVGIYMLSEWFDLDLMRRSLATSAEVKPSCSRPTTNGRIVEPACCF